MTDLNVSSVDRLISETEKRLKALRDLRATYGPAPSATVKGKTKASAKGKSSGKSTKGKAATADPREGTIRRGSVNEKILNFLDGNPADRKTILAATGANSKSFGPTMATLAKRGYVTRPENGIYSRTTKPMVLVGQGTTAEAPAAPEQPTETLSEPVTAEAPANA